MCAGFVVMYRSSGFLQEVERILYRRFLLSAKHKFADFRIALINGFVHDLHVLHSVSSNTSIYTIVKFDLNAVLYA